jgi:hypothetical protein
MTLSSTPNKVSETIQAVISMTELKRKFKTPVLRKLNDLEKAQNNV